MGLLSSIFRPQARIDESSELYQVIHGTGAYSTSKAGTAVTPATAMRCSAVFACVNVISQTVAQLPIHLYRRTPQGKQFATEHPLYHLIGSKPNSFHNSFAFREMLTAITCLQGNAFAFINRVGNGRVYELLPLEPNSVGIHRDPYTWEITYQVNQKKGINGIYTPKEVLHVMGMTLNGYQGVTPITYAREAIGLAIATEEHGARSYKNGARPGMAIKVPGKLGDVTYERMKASFNEVFSGVENTGKPFFAEDGMDIVPLSMNMVDAQYIEQRQLQIPEIARFYRMPLHKIQDMTASTNNNIEQQALEFISDTMLPWLTRWEASLNTQLLTPAEQKEYFFKFDVDDILRADMKSRFEAYSSAIASEIFNPNECREKEDMNPYPGGEIYSNRNTKPATTPGKWGTDGAK